MELSPEDALRLNVLLANKPLAIRINESNMTVSGLTDNGEARVELKPNCRDEQYIKRVKELISGHVLGSPGGYPVYLQRWTRMGQMRDDSLEQLLMLGEPEAVVAAVCAPGLSDELARRAWWAMEDAENARQMLRKPAVRAGHMGPVLAAYLVEYLPFESEAEKQIETVSLVLEPGLLSDEQQHDLWRKASRKAPYYVGFIATLPDALPEAHEPHTLWLEHGAALQDLAGRGDATAAILLRILSGEGQAWLHTVYRIFKKPSNQDVVNITLDRIAGYFSAIRGQPADATLQELEQEADTWVRDNPALQSLARIDPAFEDLARRVRVLSGLGYGVVRPVFKGTTAIGSLMRRKLEPVLEPLLAHLDALTASPPRR